MVAAPRSMPKRGPKARPARISRIKTASTPPTPVLATRTAEPTAARTPSNATVCAERTEPSRDTTTATAASGAMASAA